MIVGAGGHARSVIALLERSGFSVGGVYDDSFDPSSAEKISGYPILAKTPEKDKRIVLAAGDNLKRSRLFTEWRSALYEKVIIHPSAIIEKRVTFGASDLVFASAVVNSESMIGDNNILNTCCVVEHECHIGDHNHISVGAILCGRVNIGSRCFIGAGSVIIDGIRICDDVIIGANSVVIKDITVAGTYAGNPARKIK